MSLVRDLLFPAKKYLQNRMIDPTSGMIDSPLAMQLRFIQGISLYSPVSFLGNNRLAKLKKALADEPTILESKLKELFLAKSQLEEESKGFSREIEIIKASDQYKKLADEFGKERKYISKHISSPDGYAERSWHTKERNKIWDEMEKMTQQWERKIDAIWDDRHGKCTVINAQIRELKSAREELAKLTHILSSLLPEDVQVKEMKEVKEKVERKESNPTVSSMTQLHLSPATFPHVEDSYGSIFLDELIEKFCIQHCPTEQVEIYECRGDIVLNTRDPNNLVKLYDFLENELSAYSMQELQIHETPEDLFSFLRIEEQGGDARASVSLDVNFDGHKQIRSKLMLDAKSAAPGELNANISITQITQAIRRLLQPQNIHEEGQVKELISAFQIKAFDQEHANAVWLQESRRTKDGAFPVSRIVADQKNMRNIFEKIAAEKPQLKNAIDRLLTPRHKLFLRKFSWKQYLKKKHLNQIALSGQFYRHKDRILFQGKTEVVKSNPNKPHLIFVLDRSGSMAANERMENVKKAVIAVAKDQIEAFNIDAYSTIITFDDQASVVVKRLRSFDPESKTVSKDFAQQIEEKVKKIKPGNFTAYRAPLQEAYKNIEPNEQVQIIFLTDGAPNYDGLTRTQDYERVLHEDFEKAAKERGFDPKNVRFTAFLVDEESPTALQICKYIKALGDDLSRVFGIASDTVSEQVQSNSMIEQLVAVLMTIAGAQGQKHLAPIVACVPQPISFEVSAKEGETVVINFDDNKVALTIPGQLPEASPEIIERHHRMIVLQELINRDMNPNAPKSILENPKAIEKLHQEMKGTEGFPHTVSEQFARQYIKPEQGETLDHLISTGQVVIPLAPPTGASSYLRRSADQLIWKNKKTYNLPDIPEEDQANNFLMIQVAVRMQYLANFINTRIPIQLEGSQLSQISIPILLPKLSKLADRMISQKEQMLPSPKDIFSHDDLQQLKTFLSLEILDDSELNKFRLTLVSEFSEDKEMKDNPKFKNFMSESKLTPAEYFFVWATFKDITLNKPGDIKIIFQKIEAYHQKEQKMREIFNILSPEYRERMNQLAIMWGGKLNQLGDKKLKGFGSLPISDLKVSNFLNEQNINFSQEDLYFLESIFKTLGFEPNLRSLAKNLPLYFPLEMVNYSLKNLDHLIQHAVKGDKKQAGDQKEGEKKPVVTLKARLTDEPILKMKEAKMDHKMEMLQLRAEALHQQVIFEISRGISALQTEWEMLSDEMISHRQELQELDQKEKKLKDDFPKTMKIEKTSDYKKPFTCRDERMLGFLRKDRDKDKADQIVNQLNEIYLRRDQLKMELPGIEKRVEELSDQLTPLQQNLKLFSTYMHMFCETGELEPHQIAYLTIFLQKLDREDLGLIAQFNKLKASAKRVSTLSDGLFVREPTKYPTDEVDDSMRSHLKTKEEERIETKEDERRMKLLLTLLKQKFRGNDIIQSLEFRLAEVGFPESHFRLPAERKVSAPEKDMQAISRLPIDEVAFFAMDMEPYNPFTNQLKPGVEYIFQVLDKEKLAKTLENRMDFQESRSGSYPSKPFGDRDADDLEQGDRSSCLIC